MNNFDKHNKIREGLVEIDRIPNPPFNTKAIKKYLQQKGKFLGFQLVSNQYYSYIHVTSNPGAQKLVLFSHTDHPAFVFKDRDSGILFGKFDTNQVVSNIPIDIQVYDRDGNYVFDEKIVNMKGREFITSGIHKAKSNFSARFKINEEVSEGKLGMYSADNYLGTYSLINLLGNEKIRDSKFDIYFVFNHFEEVFQLGSVELDEVVNSDGVVYVIQRCNSKREI